MSKKKGDIFYFFKVRSPLFTALSPKRYIF